MSPSRDLVARLAASCALALTLGCPSEQAGSTDGGPSAAGDGSAASDDGQAAGGGPDAAALAEWAKSTFGVLPEVAEPDDYELTDAKVDLGRKLYYETRISLAKDVSCNTCHPLDEFGVDGDPTSTGHEGQRGDFNAPTVYNAAFQTAQFWDAREPDVEAQALGPLTNPVEMAMGSHDEVIARLKEFGYEGLFEEAFPEAAEPLSIDNVGIAIGAFERKLNTPAPIDAFMKGDHDALTREQLEGLAVYKEVNCQMCHMGTLLGGNMQQVFGLQAHWPKEPGSEEQHPDSKKMFKVPMLRNVTETGPYLHDGSVADLGELVSMMAEHQLNKDLSEEDAKAIVAFLESLKGDVSQELVAKPELPQ